MDEDVIPQLNCDVELAFSGPNVATLNKWAADTLRKLADSIESDELSDGDRPVRDKVGKTVGTVHIEYSGELI